MPVNTAAEAATMSVYRERAHLVAFLTTLYPSVGAYNDPDEPDYMVVYVETPVGQMAWHIHPDDADLFDGLQIVEDHVWDGHTTEEKYRKLRNFTALRRMPVMAPQSPTPGRSRLDGLLADYDSKHVAASLRRQNAV
jgi:hypothetical protein